MGFWTLSILNLYGQQTDTVDYSHFGLTFEIPEGWVGQENEFAYIMGHTTIPGAIMVIPHDQQYTVEGMLAEVNKGLDFGSGTYFEPFDDFTIEGEKLIYGTLTGTIENSPAMGYVSGLANPYGNGLTIMAISIRDVYQSDIFESVVKQVANSVVFSKPVNQQQSLSSISSNTSVDIADWNYQLGGTKLTYMDSYNSGGTSGGGYSMKTEIHLCKAGYFLFYDQNFMSTGSGSSSAYSAGNSNGDGNWKIINQSGVPYLILNFNSGEQSRYPLEWGEDYKLFLNGYRYFRTWEGDYAPDCRD